ncbi:carboxymuconolactone decarboxylase family protein [Aspergillus ibericus CBS 121593]|uniref:4-carboxymuconolactone decarboxylase family protein n=1 Tax=Aspergillus ibericus CBS 121593 TaxID=1448316 RepID=A0A395GUH5_9EURO|nr:4-carboxymuconolactone decarboxylase family protein [Aspergillus ibericus CBS 121593]RAK99079.1 4-carboxymuconolactone decarboxylase family protein [Aspergillus ibericus CBS 121593]
MRLPYVSNPPPTSTPEEANIFARMQARRAPGDLLPLDLALLHSFPIAEGWNTFLGAIRSRTSLSTVIRELIICRVAVLNGAEFEWEQHAPLLKEAGLSEEAMQAIRDVNLDISQNVQYNVLSREEGAVLKYTDAMTKTVTVPEEIFQEVKTYFNDREVVEITSTAAAYNCVSRFLVALDVGEMNHD